MTLRLFTQWGGTICEEGSNTSKVSGNVYTNDFLKITESEICVLDRFYEENTTNGYKAKP